ncbi:MAG: tetratricopeptide repeat protein [Eubacterium sp.]|nr:tetratricopeptide repeat protein [Eubacterium sp.]
MESYFELLGLEPTTDENRIKKAYRKLLHTVNPEDDAEGFKRLREAYEQACAYAKKAEDSRQDDQEKSPVEVFIDHCQALYADFFKRADPAAWEDIFEEAGFFDLEQEEELRIHFLRFLMEHYHLPFAVWKEADRVFRITGYREDLIEHFPEAYVDYLQQAVLYEGALNYDLFEGDPDADFDHYIDVYQKLRQYTDVGMTAEAREALGEIRQLKVYHPYTDLDSARILLQEERKEEAEEIFARLAHDYDGEERIICTYGQFLGLENRWDEIGDLYDRLLISCPDSIPAKIGKAELLNHQGSYRQARDLILDLLEVNPQDERLMQDLNDCNVSMISELEPLAEKGSLDQEGLMDLAWCYYQNMRFDDGIKLMDSFEPDENHVLDYHNLRGRILLTQEKDEEALVHLIPWLEGIRDLTPDGTKKTERRIARLGYAYYTIGAAKAGIILSRRDKDPADGQELKLNSAEADKPGLSVDISDDMSEAMTWFEKAIEAEKDPAQAISYRHTMADIWRQCRNYPEMLKACEDLLKESPQYFPGVILRQEACLALGMYQECADDYARAINLYPYHGKPYATMMKMYFLFGDYKSAGEVLSQADQVQADSDDLALMKARLTALNAQSKEELEQALKILDDRHSRGWDMQSDLDQEEWQEINFRRGLILTDLQRSAEAREAFEEAMTKRHDSGIYYSYASLMMQCREYGKAAEYFEKVREEAPQDTGLLYKLGWCYKELGDYDRSLSFMKEVLRLNPGHEAVRMVMTELYERLARREEDNRYYEMALPLMRDQLASNPDAYHHIEMGLLYLDMDRYEDALVHFEEAIRLEPDSIYGYNNAGSCYLSLEMPEKAIPYFEKAIALMEKEHSVLPYNNLAKCYRMLGNPEEALACYRKNLDLYPHDDEIILQMADCLREQERYQEAREIYLKAIPLARYANTLECALLRLYGEMGDRKGFEACAEKLLKKYPENPVILQLTGETWLYGFAECDYAIYYLKKALDCCLKTGRESKNDDRKDSTGQRTDIVDCIRLLPAEYADCARGCLYLWGRALLYKASRKTNIRDKEVLEVSIEEEKNRSEIAGTAHEGRRMLEQYLESCRDSDSLSRNQTEDTNRPGSRKDDTVYQYESFCGESRRRRFRMGYALWFLGQYEKAKEYFDKVRNYPCRCDGCCKPYCFEGRIAEALMLYAEGKGREAIALYQEAVLAAANDLEHRFEIRNLIAAQQ